MHLVKCMLSFIAFGFLVMYDGDITKSGADNCLRCFMSLGFKTVRSFLLCTMDSLLSITKWSFLFMYLDSFGSCVFLLTDDPYLMILLLLFSTPSTVRYFDIFQFACLELGFGFDCIMVCFSTVLLMSCR